MNESDKKWTLLLVDDEEDIREVLSISLVDMGYDVHTAGNGPDALAIINEVNPSIVLTDIKMPGMDGIELLQEIKRHNPDTEVVMITGHGDMDLAIKSLKYEATDFISKPITVDALEIALKKVVDKIIMQNKLKEYTANLETLVREKMELQDHLSSLGLMIGSISHGIKGLLTSLDGGIYLVDSGFAKKDDAQVKEGFEIVRLVLGRIRKMILDILFYAKEREIKTEPVNILTFANDVADAVKPKIQGHDIELARDFAAAPTTFHIDEDLIRSALINILDNAVDACIADSEKEAHKINFGVKHDAANLIFEIHDNGIGMDSEKIEKAFELFFSSKGGKGTGFGLFIVDKIIKQHRGTINVNSAKGKGTLFSIKIPKALSNTK
ncbi:MAG: hybrid sensor histidine kinase/response regulator [Desulfobacterales bacterium]|nr:hybrid sensor histidine kinase/response regulator [Desulfobacterales bacterium]